MSTKKLDTVVGLKLINGMEIIGKVVKESTKEYSLKDAMIAHPQQMQDRNGEARLSVSLMPVTFFSVTTEHSFAVDIEVNKGTVVFSYVPNSDILSTYTDALLPRAVTPVEEPSRLIVPQTGKIIL